MGTVTRTERASKARRRERRVRHTGQKGRQRVFSIHLTCHHTSPCTHLLVLKAREECSFPKINDIFNNGACGTSKDVVQTVRGTRVPDCAGGLRLLYIPPLSLLLLLLFLFLLAGPLRLQVLVDALQRPVKHVVHVVPLPNEELSEEPFQVAVVRLVLEAQASGVVEVRGKLRGKALAQHLHGRCLLALGYARVLFLLRVRFQALPRQ
ncbi:putative DNA-directed RNA polymerase subunit [Trypanosoma cruzi]|uniref:Putative DNA-directed RNA polymerase subunit n=1 Tax=Trypanosoma cruzi TaxID=5693 RepID=A0A2V2X0U7_TRYCR|nr:putative DNA-directed RNA polymerase subunit [Trypanosoma cruzi]